MELIKGDNKTQYCMCLRIAIDRSVRRAAPLLYSNIFSVLFQVIIFFSFLSYSSAQSCASNQTSVTITQSIVLGTDDAEEITSSGTMYTTWGNVSMVDYNQNTPQIVGYRFQNISIPQGSTITNASIVFNANNSNSNTTNLVIRAHDVNNSSTFLSANSDISTRVKTTASTAWNSIPVWNTNSLYTSPNIANVVQEIINRGGWNAGNAITFIIEGSGTRVSDSFESSNSIPAELSITYCVNVPQLKFVIILLMTMVMVTLIVQIAIALLALQKSVITD